MPKKFLLAGVVATIVMVGSALVGGFSYASAAVSVDPVSTGFAAELDCDTARAIGVDPALPVQVLASMNGDLDWIDDESLISFHEVTGCWDATSSWSEWVYMGPDRGWVKVTRSQPCRVCGPIDHGH